MAKLRRKPSDMVAFAEDECPLNAFQNLWFEPMIDDVNAFDDTEQAFDDVERLSGGADDDDDDDLDDKKPSSNRTRVEEEPPPPPTLFRRLLNLTKIGLLLLVWGICTVCLMYSEEKVGDVKLLSIPVGAAKNYIVQEPVLGSSLGIELNGPFAVEDEIQSTEEAERKYLTIQIERVIYEGDTVKETTGISNTWKLKLSNAASPVDIEKDRVLKLYIDGDSITQNQDMQIRFTSNNQAPITVKLSVDHSPVDQQNGILYGSLILLGLYVVIVWDLINRTFAAIMASTMAIGVLGVLGSRPSLDAIMKWIDIETMMLLFGMMILVAVLSESGIFDYLAVYAYKITKGRIWPLINCLCLFTAVLSSFLDNVTMMLLVTPVTIRLCEVTDLNPVPILMSMVIFSNIGAAVTPVGDPPNVLICMNSFIAESGVHFGLFVLHMFPAVILAMVSTYCQLRLKYRNIKDLRYQHSPEVEELMHEIIVWERLAASIGTLSADEEDVRGTILKKISRLKEELKEKMTTQAKEMNFDDTLKYLEAEYPIRNKVLLYKTGVAFIFVLTFFCLHSVPNFVHLSLGWTAFLGALMALILADIDDMQAILARIEWSTLLFFAGLFILMECLTELGLIDVIGNCAINLVLAVNPQHRLLLALFIILWITAISSAFLDNIPVTTMMIKIIISLSQNKELQLPLHPLVWALALGACFGGNGTLIGASANVVCAGIAGQHGYKITFMQFFLIGFPVVLSSVTVATIYLVTAHILFQWH